jgi:hypothetical protein
VDHLHRLQYVPRADLPGVEIEDARVLVVRARREVLPANPVERDRRGFVRARVQKLRRTVASST